MDEASNSYDKALDWLKAGVGAAEVERRLKATGLDAGELRLLLAAATHTLQEQAGPGAPRAVARPSAPIPPSFTGLTVLKVIGGLVALVGLLGVAFILFALVVGSVWGWH